MNLVELHTGGKSNRLGWLLFVSLLLAYAPLSAQSSGRFEKTIDASWKFYRGRIANAQSKDFDDSDWKTVRLPHDWRIHDQYDKNNRRNSGYLPKGVGWYRKDLTDIARFQGKRVALSFDGVFRNYTVFVNGEKAGWHLSGYTGYVLDITDLLDFRSKRNVIAVFVDNEDSVAAVKPHPQSEYGPGHEGWWYEGYGIYRPVHLIVTDPVHVAPWGTFVFTKNESRSGADVYIRTKIKNQSDRHRKIQLKTTLLNPEGTPVRHIMDSLEIGSHSSIKAFQETRVEHPELWSPDHPQLYSVVTEVVAGGKLLDSYKAPLGIRWFKFTADSGFYLNGEHLQLRGMNIHAGFGGLGTALPDAANRYDVKLAKEMGCNMIRSAHNDPSPSLMRACDSLGMLLWAETRYLGKDTFALQTLHDLLQRDRNHPSIICWGLANNSGRNKRELTKMLAVMNGIVKKMDPTRPTIFGCEYNGDPNATGFAFITDVMGYNGSGMGRDDPDHRKYPYRKMMISEYASGRGTRGAYQREKVADSKLDTLNDGHVFKTGYLYSIYDLCRAHENAWTHIATRPWLAGGLMWSGIEYVGESNGWPVVTSQFGVFDVARFKKDAYYYYKQEWTDKPMVHIVPGSWNFNKKDSLIDVWVYANCDKVELFLNGQSLGVKKQVPHGHISWKVPFYPGKLTAKGLDKDGNEIAENTVRTASRAHQLTMESDRKVLRADGKDVAFVSVEVRDKNGTPVPHADNKMKVEVTGGKLLALCSGNPVNHQDPALPAMAAFNGKLRAIVRVNHQKGKLKINVKSKNLEPATIVLKKE